TRGLVGVLAGDRGDVTAVAERPRVVEALEQLAGPLPLAAEDGAAVEAAVEPGTDLAAAVTAEDHRPAAERAGLEVVGLGDFGLVAQVQPRARPDPVALRLEDLLRAVGDPIDAESQRVPVLDDQPPRKTRAIRSGHRAPPPSTPLRQQHRLTIRDTISHRVQTSPASRVVSRGSKGGSSLA